MKNTFISTVKENINRDGIENLLNWLETTDFYTTVASSRHHNSFEGGLVSHSLNVYNLLKASPNLNDYSDESIAIVSLFHDFCKINYYEVSTRNVKNKSGIWEQVPYYKVSEKFPFGHGEKSVFIVNQFIKLSNEEALAINWHMGGFDSRVRGGSFSIGEAYNLSKLALELNIADMRATYILENNNNNLNVIL